MTTDPTRRVFLVEDDDDLRALLANYLKTHGLLVDALSSAEQLLALVSKTKPDLIVMDIGLPGLSGLDACQQLRRDGDLVPIILLTARNDEIDRVVGLELGADDYVGKPFSARELLARIRVALRRVQSVVGTKQPLVGTKQPLRSVRIGQHTFIPDLRCLNRGEEVRVLNSIEFALLDELTGNPGVPVARERLLAVSHARTDTVLIRAVDAAIMRLRRMVEPDPANPRYLLTVRFQGYVFVPTTEDDVAT